MWLEWLHFPLPSISTIAQLCREFSHTVLIWNHSISVLFSTPFWFWLCLYCLFLQFVLVLICCGTSEVNPCKKMGGKDLSVKPRSFQSYVCGYLFIYFNWSVVRELMVWNADLLHRRQSCSFPAQEHCSHSRGREEASECLWRFCAPGLCAPSLGDAGLVFPYGLRKKCLFKWLC